MFNGKRLREKLKFYGWDEDSLGEKVGVTGRSINLYMHDKVCPAADTVEKLAIVFGEPVAFFFDGLDRDTGKPIQGDKDASPV